MNISKQTLNFNDIEENLDAIKKKLYLESPDLWIDFCDKVDEKILDEMVLFYASKYNYSNVIKFAIDNNITDINKPSKNRTYTSIKEHLISVARDCNSKDVFNFLNNNEQIKNKDTNKIESIKEEKYKELFDSVSDILSDLTSKIEEISLKQDYLEENIEYIDNDLTDIQDELFEEVSFDDLNSIEDEYVEIKCDNCDKPLFVEQQALNNNSSIPCPFCGGKARE